MKLYLYGYLDGIRSSRKLENKTNLIKVFKDFSHLCKELGLYGEELIAIDGTKIKANNSKRNNYNKKKIDRQIKYIDEKTSEYLKSLEENDLQ